MKQRPVRQPCTRFNISLYIFIYYFFKRFMYGYLSIYEVICKPITHAIDIINSARPQGGGSRGFPCKFKNYIKHVNILRPIEYVNMCKYTFSKHIMICVCRSYIFEQPDHISEANS